MEYNMCLNSVQDQKTFVEKLWLILVSLMVTNVFHKLKSRLTNAYNVSKIMVLTIAISKP